MLIDMNDNFKPKVSVVIPCYNAEKFIEETIESVLAQDYDNWELLIVDDCSSDESAAIIRSFTQKDERIKYYKTEQRSGTPAQPRNIGIHESKGEYIALLDSDDLWLPTKLSSQLNFVQRTGADFVYSNCRTFKGDKDIQAEVILPESANYKDMLRQDYVPLLTILIKKATILEIQFESRPQEDYVWLLHVLKGGTIAYNTNSIEALYRIVDNSRSSNKLRMMKEHYKVLRSEGCNYFKSGIYTFTHSLGSFLKYKGVRVRK